MVVKFFRVIDEGVKVMGVIKEGVQNFLEMREREFTTPSDPPRGSRWKM